MKKVFLFGFLCSLFLAGFSQSTNTLLWRVSGEGLSKPSYLFGTMHLLCADDIDLSDSLKSAISKADKVYLELEMDNMFEMIGAMQHMQMRGDTTLADLLTESEYKKVKRYFEENGSMLPFAMLETYKPLLVTALIAEQQAKTCDNMVAMEQLIMKEAKNEGKKIKGLETMNYQLAIFDKIPYRFQAKQLYQMVSGETKDDGTEIKKLTEAYRSQKLDALEDITKSEDTGMKDFANILLYDRNANWAKQLIELMSKNSLVVAVGAGHLPGKKGVISLLRQAGYKVEPVKNEMVKKVKGKEI